MRWLRHGLSLLALVHAVPASAAISFVGGCEGSAISGGNVTLTLPGGLAQSDFVIISYGIGDADGVDHDMAMVTAGYTEVADLFADDAQDTNLGVFWKLMGGTPDTTAEVTGRGDANASVAAVCMVFRGVDTGTPFDVTTTTATALNTMHPDPPSIDLVTAAAWTVATGAGGHFANVTTATLPTNYTTNAVDANANDDSDVTIGIGYRTDPADPENPGVITLSGADSVNNSWAAATLALRPASTTTAGSLLLRGCCR